MLLGSFKHSWDEEIVSFKIKNKKIDGKVDLW
jgi:hypothetical protein